MTFDSDNFLDALATLLVERAAALSPAVQIKYETTPRELWIHQVSEGDAAVCYSVLRVYGGPARSQVPLRWNSIQCDTRAGSSKAAIDRANLLASLLCDDNGTPLRNIACGDDWFILAVKDLGEPGLLGVDAEKRHQVAFNFGVKYRPA